MPSAAAPVPYSANATTFTLFALGRGYVYTKQSDGPIDLVAACKAMKDDFIVACHDGGDQHGRDAGCFALGRRFHVNNPLALSACRED